MTPDLEQHREAPPPEFLSWLESVEGGSSAGPQHAFDVLLAEHHLMEGVFRSMEIEVQSLLDGKSIRSQYWGDVVDFIGNFVHMVHRPKEEELIFPSVARWAPAAREDISECTKEHEHAEELTLGLCDAVEEGDWERVLKVVVLYVDVLRAHLRREEDHLLRPLRQMLSEKDSARLAVASEDVELQGMGDRGRQHCLSVVRRICKATELDWPLGG